MSKKIMVVDDSKFMRTVLSEILTKNGFEIVMEAENGEKAVKEYKELKGTDKEPDIIFMDITMPVKTGIQATQEITAFDPDAKIIICSSNTIQDSVLEALRSGAKYFIAKPFDPSEVIEKVEKTIKKHMK